VIVPPARVLLRFFAPLGLLSLSMGLAQADTATRPAVPSLEGGGLELRFDRADGSLVEFVERSNGHNHVEPGVREGLWSVDFGAGAPVASITPAMAKSFSWVMGSGSDSGIRFVWRDFDLAQMPELCVTARVALSPAEPVSTWRIEVEGLDGPTPLAVRFPRLAHLARQENEVLAVPVWMGEKTRRARELLNDAKGRGLRREWDYPGHLSLQCLALYREGGPGLYLASNDTAALRKHFAAFGDGRGGLGVEVLHLLEKGRDRPRRYAPAYDVLVGAFTGDWFTAAEWYRAWARRQPWARDSRLRRGLVPSWVLDTGLWIWNRGRSENVLEPAAVLGNRVKLPISVFWHWWHGCAYDVGFPEYLPPREGEDAFRKALAAAHAHDIHAMVYMNQRLWGMTTRTWAAENAERYAVKGPNGRVNPEVYNTFVKAPCASMCMGTPFWRDKYAGLAEAAVRGLGVDGIYMDQACSSLACYDPTHGHSVGGGAYWMNGFRLLEGDIRRRCGPDRPVVLAGEGCGEAWLPQLDLMLSLQVSMERYAAPGQWEPIPFFHAVYHDCAVLYGNYSSLTYPPYDELWPAEFAPKPPLRLLDRKFARQFRLEQARAFVWGQQPTIANFRPSHLEERPEELAFLARLATLRMRATKYLLHGVFLRPPAIDAGEDEVPMSRLSIYAGQQGAVKEFRRAVPRALAGAWRAADGDVGVVIVNIADAPVGLRLGLKRGDYPLGERGTVRCLTEHEVAEVGQWTEGRAELEVTIPPCSSRVYEFTSR
jgi:hypothetical protein